MTNLVHYTDYYRPLGKFQTNARSTRHPSQPTPTNIVFDSNLGIQSILCLSVSMFLNSFGIYTNKHSLSTCAAYDLVISPEIEYIYICVPSPSTNQRRASMLSIFISFAINSHQTYRV